MHLFGDAFFFCVINLMQLDILLSLLRTKGALAHLSRALDWQSKGDRFESDMLHCFYILFGMIIYNITFHIEKDILPDCLNFLKSTYIPLATQSGFMHSPRMHRVLPHVDEEEGNSYAIQFRVKNVDTLNYWIEQEGLRLSHELVRRFGSKVIGFTTVLEEVEL